MKSLLFICLSIHLCISQSLNFLKIRTLVFSDIVDDDSWPWYLVTDKARLLKKRFWCPEFWPNLPKSVPKWVFWDFLEFGLYVFVEITYDDSLWQYLLSNRGKSHKIHLGAQQTKIGPKICFSFTILSSLVY